MSDPAYSEQELDEIMAMEARHGFPGMIAHADDPALTPFQRQHAQAWRKVANARFGAELHNQLGRPPSVEELIDRLALSLAMHGASTTRPTTR